MKYDLYYTVFLSNFFTNVSIADDTKPSRKFPDVHSCWLKCECKNEDCFYGDDPCACQERKPCAVNHTMNRISGGIDLSF